MKRAAVAVLCATLTACYLVTVSHTRPELRVDGSTITGEIRCEVEVTFWGLMTDDGSLVGEYPVPCGEPLEIEVPHDHYIFYRIRAEEKRGDAWVSSEWSDYVYSYQVTPDDEVDTAPGNR